MSSSQYGSENTPTFRPLPGLPFFVAHTPPKGKNAPWHPLTRHIIAVSDTAAWFAEAFGGSILARSVGLLHGLGKFDPVFQEYLLACYRNPNNPPPPGSAPHKQAGALAVRDTSLMKFAAVWTAQIIWGHHGGMTAPKETGDKAKERQQAATWDVATMRACARAIGQADGVDLDPDTPALRTLFPNPHFKREIGFASVEMYMRFVFSCLTDADGLDTEAHKKSHRLERAGEG